MESEKISADWKKMRDVLGNDVNLDVKMLNCATRLDKLASRYKKFYILGFIWSVIVMCCYASLGWFCFLFSAFMLLSAFIDVYMYKQVRSIDVLSMPVADVIAKSMLLRRRHLQFVCVLLPLAFALIGMFVWFYCENVYILYGIIAGVVLGLPIGLYHLREFMRDYKEMA